MEKKFILHSTTQEEFFGQLSEIIENILTENNRKEEERENQLMTQKEVAKFLKVCTVTVGNIKKRGELVAERVAGSRAVRYKYSEVLKTLKQRDYGQYMKRLKK